MKLSNTRAVTSLGIVGFMVALGASACSSDSDKGGSSAGSGGAIAHGGAGGAGAGTSGKAGGHSAGAGDSDGENAGEGGDLNTGGAAGEGGASDAGAAGIGAGGDGPIECNANLQIDPENCGRCGHSCGTAECTDGLCYAEPVLVPKPIVDELTLSGYKRRTFFNAGNLYAWSKVTDSTQDPDLRYRLLRTPTDATPLPTRGVVVQDIPDAASAPYYVDAVNYDSTYLYQCTTTGGTRTALSATAATPTVIFKAPIAGLDCNDIAVSSTALFMSSHDTVGGKDTLYTIPIASFAPTAVPTLVPNIGARDNDISSLTVVGDNLYWIENDLTLNAEPPNLVTAPTAGLAVGGKPTKIDSDLGNESASIASDGSYLYWTDTHGQVGELRRTKLPYVAGAQPEVLLQDLDGVNAGIVLDANYVYVMEANNASGNVVYRVKKDGSSSDQLGIAFVNDDDQHKGLQMTGVDASYVYFLLFDGIIGRLPVKP